MTPEDEREALGYILAGYFSGNNQPDMSGDPRKRLSPLRRRDLDDAISEILRAGYTRGNSAAMREALAALCDVHTKAYREAGDFGTACAIEDLAARILALPAPEPVAPPSMTDLMVTPESIDAFMDANPLPPEPVTHDLYETGEKDAPDCIKDRNGEVVLGLCRKCGKAEAELDGPCCTPEPVTSSVVTDAMISMAAALSAAVSLAGGVQTSRSPRPW